ncbi:MAG: WG repeat-containing protein [Bacteroidetes bacterium]|nr:WG repeat-containing protein [Bacteroidota bacterium]MBU1717466.1 WG repeat-containing protein [Bacteroidota bacterium]
MKISAQPAFWQPPTEPEVIYYNFYNGIQMIEIDHNSFEQIKIAYLDAINPINSIRYPMYGHNAIIFRKQNGEIIAQYNLSGFLNNSKTDYKASDFIPPQELTVTHPHLLPLIGKTTQTNYPSSGEYVFFVSDGKKAGLIDTLGNILLDIKYDNIIYFDHRYAVNLNGKWGFTDSNFQTTIAPVHTSLIPIKENVLKIGTSRFGLIDYNGNILLDTVYDELIYKQDFFLYHRRETQDSSRYNLYGIIDFEYNIVTPQIYYQVEDFYENYQHSRKYWACKTDGCGFIDSVGNPLSAFRYGTKPIFVYGYYRTSLYPNSNNRVALNTDFREIGTQYDEVKHWYRNGLFIVKQNEKYGVINSFDSLILPCEYDLISSDFKNHITYLQKDGKKGVVNDKGQILVPCKYDAMTLDVAYGKIIPKFSKDVLN